jgi:hypothetical protein
MAEPVLLRGRREPLHPGVQVGLGDPAQHRIDVPGGAGAIARPHQFDGGRDGGVRRDPGVQQLVGAQPKGVDHLTIELGERTVAAGGDHRIQLAQRPAAAVGQLGGQRGVPAADPPVAQDRRQRQVGVRAAAADRGQQIQGGLPGRVVDRRAQGRRPPRRSGRTLASAAAVGAPGAGAARWG